MNGPSMLVFLLLVLAVGAIFYTLLAAGSAWVRGLADPDVPHYTDRDLS